MNFSAMGSPLKCASLLSQLHLEMRERDSGWDSIFKLHQKHGKKWRITHCKSVWIHVSIHFTWSTNNLGLLLSCCTIEAIILKRKLVKDWMGKFSLRLGEVLKGTTKDTLQLTDVLTGEAESLPICGTKLICKFWATAAKTLNSFFLFRETAHLQTNEGVCLCLCVFVNSYWPGCLRVPLLFLSILWNVIVSWILKQERLACQAWNCRQ